MMQHLPAKKTLALAALCVATLLLAGCPVTPRAGGPPSVDKAEQYVRAGDHAQAAAIYERLAGEAAIADRAEFLLRAARAYIAAGRTADAERVLTSLPHLGLTEQQTIERTLLGMQLAVAQGRADQAWRDISAMPVPTASAAAARYYETRQQVAIATNHVVDGIRAELARERLIAPGEVQAVRAQLLGQLRAAAERGAVLTPPPNTDATVRGWLEAGSIAFDNARNPTLAATRMNSFRARYPTHPSLAALAGEPGIGIPEPAPMLENAPHMALMLPLTGRTAAASAQIQDGFMTAYYQLAASVRPRLRVYDTGSAAVADLIASAKAAGAQFIVGPLTREEVVAAAEQVTTRPPMLSLNFLPADHPAPERFFQFALSPEDDARAVARFVAASGKRRGVVLTPEGDWGARVLAAFDEELRGAGGYLLGQATFNAADRDYAASIMNVLRTDDSRVRAQRVQASIGQKLEFEPRRRPDIQFIFAPSPAGAARLLRPQLRYHLAGTGGDIPVYSLSDAYEPHPSANREIDGVIFPDIPWMLSESGLSAEVRETAARSFGDSNARRGRLFAFGYDAFRIASSLQRGSPINPEGLTGTLSLDAEGHVRRELEWVRIKDGAPTPIAPGSSAAVP